MHRRAGDAEFARLVRPELDRLLRGAVLLCGDRSLAEDLVQSVLARVFASGRWAEAEHLYAYLRQCVLREYLAGRRRRAATELSLEDLPDRAHGSSSDPDAAERIDVSRALDRLSPLDRAVLVLRYAEDLSVDDTAAALGCSAGAVRTRSGRAASRLRTLLLQGSPTPTQPSGRSTR